MKLALFTLLLMLSAQCLSGDYFEIAVVREEIYLDGVKIELKTAEEKLKATPRPAYLFAIEPNKVNYLSIMLYLTKNDHQLYLSENEDFTSITTLEGKEVNRIK
jgi:hypothetical protein